jgi:hypothetical protein
VKIPVGSYSQCRVSLKHGDIEAIRSLDRYGAIPPADSVVVKAMGEAGLNLGGPLTNSVSANRRGKTLVLNYRLLGAGGQVYELSGPRSQPAFAVYSSGKQIASGMFEYG